MQQAVCRHHLRTSYWHPPSSLCCDMWAGGPCARNMQKREGMWPLEAEHRRQSSGLPGFVVTSVSWAASRRGEGRGGSQYGGPLLQAQMALSLRFQSGGHYGGLRKCSFNPSSLCLASWGLGAALQGSDESEPEDVRILKST